MGVLLFRCCINFYFLNCMLLFYLYSYIDSLAGKGLGGSCKIRNVMSK